MTNTSKSRAVHARVDACALATLLSCYKDSGPTTISQVVTWAVIDRAYAGENTGYIRLITDPEQAHRILDEFVARGGSERATVKDALGKIEAGLGGE